MKSPLVLCALAAWVVTPTYADDTDLSEAERSRNTINVVGEGCRYLSQHFPSPDTAASAVDAYGRGVAPADLDPTFRPTALHLLVEGPSIERQSWRSEPSLMEVTVDLETGELSSRGRPVPGLSSADLVKACGRNRQD